MKRSEIAFSASLVPIDYLMIILAGITAYNVRLWEPVQNIRPVIFDLPYDQFMAVLLVIPILWLIMFGLAGLYTMKSTRRTVDEISKIFLGSSTAIMGLMFIFFFSRNLFDSRFIIVAGWLFSIIYIIIGRGIIRTIQHALYKINIGFHRTIIIGKNELATEAINKFKSNIKAGFRVVGQYQDFSEETEKKLAIMVRKDQFDEILVATSTLSLAQRNRLNDFSYVKHIGLKYIADIFDVPINNFEFNTISGLPIVELKKTKLDGWSKIYKRIFDIIISLLFIIILSPILIITTLAVKFGSKGPICFKYKRIGEYGKPFSYFKFRSMIDNAHKFRFDKEFLKKQKDTRHGSPVMKFKDDPRITPVGKFIRRFSIDELPELFNVLFGKMSLVGPRPHEVEEVEKYKTEHKKVLTIKPGMTGMSQVSGRSDLNFDEEIKLDVWYMENWSLKLDLMILFKTPLAVVKKRGAE